jgi:hypothetical protein
MWVEKAWSRPILDGEIGRTGGPGSKNQEQNMRTGRTSANWQRGIFICKADIKISRTAIFWHRQWLDAPDFVHFLRLV